jgi:hypothetical protein
MPRCIGPSKHDDRIGRTIDGGAATECHAECWPMAAMREQHSQEGTWHFLAEQPSGAPAARDVAGRRLKLPDEDTAVVSPTTTRALVRRLKLLSARKVPRGASRGGASFRCTKLIETARHRTDTNGWGRSALDLKATGGRGNVRTWWATEDHACACMLGA